MHNFDYIKSSLDLAIDINDISIQKIDCTLQNKSNDSGVMVCIYMYAKYQGFMPINIELSSKKRRETLFRAIRRKNFSHLATLFYEYPQGKFIV